MGLPSRSTAPTRALHDKLIGIMGKRAQRTQARGKLLPRFCWIGKTVWDRSSVRRPTFETYPGGKFNVDGVLRKVNDGAMTSDIKDDIIVLYIDLRQFLGACQLAFDGFIVQELDAVVILERLSGGSNISDGGA